MITLNGTSGNDTLEETSSGDYIVNGLAGDDAIWVRGGNQTIDGGEGFDLVYFGQLASGIMGGPVSGPGIDIDLSTGVATFFDYGHITIVDGVPVVEKSTYALTGIEGVSGTAAGDTITAAASGSRMFGQAGSDTLIGGAGNDVLVGGQGRDTLIGGDGADIFSFGSSFLGGIPGGNRVDSSSGYIDNIVDFQTGQDQLNLADVDQISGVSLVRAGAGALVFASSTSGASQTVIGVNGLIQGGDIFVSGGVNPNLQVIGQDGADVLAGGTGSDLIIGLSDSDTLSGGAGADTFLYSAQTDSMATTYDVILDFQTGQDLLDVGATQASAISIVRSSQASFVFLQTSAGDMTIAANGAVNGGDIVSGWGASHVGVYMIGDDAGDQLIGSTLGDVVQGGSGVDTLIGGAGGDALFGGAGADTFKYLAVAESGLSAADTIFDFQSGVDKIDLSGVHAAGVGSYGVAYTSDGSFLFVETNGDGVNDMLIQLTIPGLHATDIVW
ncbi:calcium-binding protein [Caulobacter sp. LjRoot300]|uniref:calcium-binding protein n=1 Tax=Caulobacter sp. LjRoot300 TaxID=3342321 RepID=UPI003ED10999